MRSRLSGTLRKDGRWQIILTLTRADGAKVQKFVYAKTQRAVQDKARKILEKGRESLPDITLSELVEMIREDKWAKQKPKTQRYNDWGLTRIEKQFGSTRLSAITRPSISSWLRSLAREKDDSGDQALSGRSIQAHKTILHGLLEYAIDLGLIRENPCSGVALPIKAKAAPPDGITERDYARVLEAEINPTLKLFWQTLGETGVRPFKEGLPLRREQILYRFDMYWIHVGDSKTAAGTGRYIAISGDLGAALMEREGEVFATSTGRLPLERNVGRAWAATLKRAKVPHCRLYALRDLGISRWVATLPDDITQTQAGHTDIRLTKNVYNRVDQERLAKAHWDSQYVNHYVKKDSGGFDIPDMDDF